MEFIIITKIKGTREGPLRAYDFSPKQLLPLSFFTSNKIIHTRKSVLGSLSCKIKLIFCQIIAVFGRLFGDTIQHAILSTPENTL